MTLPFSASNYASCQVLEGERADARDDVFSLACIAYLLLSGAHPFPKSTAIEARAAKLRLRRPANLSGRQWQALAQRTSLGAREPSSRRAAMACGAGLARRGKEIGAAQRSSGAPCREESKSWLAAGIVAGSRGAALRGLLGQSAIGTCCRASIRPRRSAPRQLLRRPSVRHRPCAARQRAIRQRRRPPCACLPLRNLRRRHLPRAPVSAPTRTRRPLRRRPAALAAAAGGCCRPRGRIEG